MTRDRIVPANGVDLCVETFGDPADPAILLIHGAGNSMLSWEEELCERLAAGARFVIRYDGRDAGRSTTAAGPFTLRDLVADAVGLLDTLGVASAHVVGMSLGGAIAQLLALDHPDRVASVTLASSTPGGPGHSQPDLPGASEELAAFFANEPPAPDWSDRAAVVEYLVEAERPFAARSRPFDEAAMRDIAERVFDRTPDLEASLTGSFAFDAGDPWRRRLGEIAAPTLVVHGTEDPLFPYGHARALADEIPGAELLALEHTGHEYFPRPTWDVVVPALLRHIAGRGRTVSRYGDVYENRVTGERAVVLRGDEDGAGQPELVHLTVKPGGAVVGEHVHPVVQERFRVIAGTLGTKLNGVERTLEAGEELTVPAGTRHDWWNAGDGDAGVLVELSPPQPRFEAMIATLFGLANAGKTNAKGLPGPLQLALIAREFSDVIQFTSPPAPVQRVLFALLGAAGRLRGYRAVYPEYLRPHGRVTPDPQVVALAGLTPPA